MNEGFEPTRAAGLARLAAFVPHMGAAYAARRNTATGSDRGATVSGLSPYVRHRLLLEQELVSAALAAHGPVAAGKFIQEVFWRAYWKGWLEARPDIWAGYRRAVREGRDRLATEAGLRQRFHAATKGATGIACFDHWARALVADNWLHNHVRMWFASIWIFTLRLPWALGAEFFARHLLDGDPASNTLSWRWVGGLHTPGKHYLARAENIFRHTAGRFDPRGELDEAAAPLTERTALAAPVPSPATPPPAAVPGGECALLLHVEDLLGECLPAAAARLRVRAVAALAPAAASAAHGSADPVRRFREAALDDAAARAAEAYDLAILRIDDAGLVDWASALGIPIVSLHAPVGPTRDSFTNRGLPIVFLRRDWDAKTWPWATQGFFRLGKRIPEIVAGLGL